MDYCDFGNEFHKEIEDKFFDLLVEQESKSNTLVEYAKMLVRGGDLDFNDIRTQYESIYNDAVEEVAQGRGITD